MKLYLFGGIAAVVALAAILHPPKPAALSVAQAPAQQSAQPRMLHRHAVAARSLVVYVAGAVNHAGLYRLPPGSRAVDAVRLAGGLRGDADPTALNLAQLLEDGQQITAYQQGAAPTRRRSAGNHSRRKHPKKKLDLADAIVPIDINTASESELAQLPGIGPQMAARLVAFRDANGAFASLDELADVAGMTPRRIDTVTAYLVIAK